MNEPENKTEQEPKKITREEADKLNDFAQSLDDVITHVVDYGDLSNTKSKKKK